MKRTTLTDLAEIERPHSLAEVGFCFYGLEDVTVSIQKAKKPDYRKPWHDFEHIEAIEERRWSAYRPHLQGGRI
jgi:hypothetical protein